MRNIGFVFLLFLSVPSLSAAAPMRVDWTGTITDTLAGALIPDFEVGRTVSGVIEFDSETGILFADCCEIVQDFLTAVTGTSTWQIGSYSFVNPFSYVGLANDEGLKYSFPPMLFPGPVDGFSSQNTSNEDTEPVLIDGVSWVLSDHLMMLVDENATVFSDRVLPETVSLDEFEIATFVFDLASRPSGVGIARVEGEVTSITVTPEPASAMLLSGGLLALGLRRRQRGQ